MVPQDLIICRTNGSIVSADCLVSDPLLSENKCPSSGWQAVETYLSLTNHMTPLAFQLKYGIASPPTYTQVTGANSLRKLRIAHEVPEFGPDYDVETAMATTQHVAVADALTTVGIMWNLAMQNVTTRGHGSVLDQLDAVHSIITDYRQPYTLASCESDSISGHGDLSPVAFPPPPGSPPQMLNMGDFNDSILSTHAFIYPGISKSQILDTPGFSGDYRLRWIELPEDPFNGTAIGAIVLLPRASENLTQDVLMCNIGAGWGTSKLNTSTFDGASQLINSEVDLSLKNLSSANPISSYTEDLAESSTGWFILPLYPQQPIIVTEDWAQYLNPSLSGSNTTVFHHLMTSHLLKSDIAVSARVILAALLANGLASIGSTSQLQGTLKTIVQSDGSEGVDGDYWFSGKGDMFIVDPVESQDWIKFHVHSSFEGFQYNTSGAIPKVAIGFLLAYCVLALAHILYAGITGVSSTCWDSIAEVTALAVNSTPSALLRNTCAGITEIDIFKIPVRVLAFRDDEKSDGEHLELVFGELDEDSVQNQVIKKNRVYGTMPVLAVEKKTL